MSMNLIFTAVDGRGLIDFPFQSPTHLTHAVLKCSNKDEQVKMIETYLKTVHNMDDEGIAEWVNETIGQIVYLSNSPHLKMDMI